MFYIPFVPVLNINYWFIIGLYSVAKYNPKAKIKNIVEINTQKELAERLTNCGFPITAKSLSQYLKNEAYNDFFVYDRENKRLILKNDFKGKQGVKFITLNNNEVSTLLTIRGTENETMLIKTFIYLKHYCSLSNYVDDTQEQILSTIGYSAKSGENCRKLSDCVNKLQGLGLIKIQRLKDNKGYFRNVYSLG